MILPLPSKYGLAVRVATPAELQEISDRKPRITVCHFSTAHKELKSRSFHREFLPLAASGFDIRYVSAAQNENRRDGVDFVALLSQQGGFRRLAEPVTLLRTLLRQRADIYHFQDPELIPIALLLKAIFQKRVLYDAYEDFPTMALSKRSIPRWLRPWAAKFIAVIEAFAAHAFDGVMTADPLTLRRIGRAGKSRKLVFYNFPNLDFFPPPRVQQKIFDVVYRGGLSERAGAFLLLDALQRLLKERRPIQALLLGYFDEPQAEARVRDRIDQLGLSSNVKVCGRIDHEDMAYTLSQARIGVSPLLATPKFSLNIPVKIFEYWACGLPVIASDLPPIRPFFKNTQAGLLFTPGAAPELAQSIRSLLDHPRIAEGMGQRGRAEVVRRFNNRSETIKFRRFCLSVAKPTRQ